MAIYERESLPNDAVDNSLFVLFVCLFVCTNASYWYKSATTKI